MKKNSPKDSPNEELAEEEGVERKSGSEENGAEDDTVLGEVNDDRKTKGQ